MLLRAATLVTGDEVLTDGWVDVRDGCVHAVGTGEPPAPVDHPLGDAVLVPGFVDVHVHGGGGHDVTAADPDDVLATRAVHLAHGTTTAMASLVTLPPDRLLRSVALLAELVQGGAFAGIHLEGPWLSPARAGAHDVRLLTPPDPAQVDAVLAAGRGTVRMVTLAPELPGGLDAVRRVAGAGALAAVGHTDADHATTRAAIEAGARVATHLFNAMPPVHHRTPGPVIALLDDPRVTVEVIADGVHQHPAVTAAVLAAAGPDRVVVVTDAMAATGMPDGRYLLGDLPVVVEGGTARRADDGAIAGGTATMDVLLRTVAATPAGLLGAVRAAATVPARLLGRPDVGRLAPGCRADAVVLDRSLHVRGVLHGGAWHVGP